MPELSYGSHMFQDLVEAGIFYCALWRDSVRDKLDIEKWIDKSGLLL